MQGNRSDHRVDRSSRFCWRGLRIRLSLRANAVAEESTSSVARFDFASRNLFRSRIDGLLVIAAVIASGVSWLPASSLAAESQAIEEVVVTARKRGESLRDVPVAISAFTREDIVQQGIKDLEDLSSQTPGLFFSEQGDQRGGRFTSVVRMRGMSINDISPVRQLASVFKDGVFVSGGVSAISMEDVERVEIIKGPQSAYFGRSTFGGAVNFISSAPSMDELGGEINLSAAEDGHYDVAGSIEAPLVSGKLGARLTGRYYTTDGRYTSSVDGGELGAEETRSANLVVAAVPSDALDVTVRLFYGKDEDSLPTTVAIGSDFYNCGPFFDGGKRFICGDVPDIDSDTLGLNTTLEGTARDIFVNNSVASDAIASFPLTLEKRGMERETKRATVAGNYSIPASAYTVSFAAGTSSIEQVRISDTDHTGQDVWVEGNFQDIEDSSFELRLTRDGERANWMVGINIFNMEYLAPTGTTIGWLFPNDFAPNGFFFDQTVSQSDVSTRGLFGSFSYALTDTVTINLEGRFQEDEIEETAPQVALEETFNNFLPRIIVQWQPTDATNLYATFARGNMPGNFNGNIAQFTEEQQQQIIEQTGATEFVDEAELDNFEIGLKQSFLGGRAFLNAAAYFMDWTNQQSRSIAVVDDDTSPAGFRTVPVVVSDAKTDLWGIELEGTLDLGDNWSLRGTYNWAASEIQRFSCLLCERVLGTADVSGNESARFPEHSGSIGAMYVDQLSNDWMWYSRVDAIYLGSAWSEVLNLAEKPESWTVNLRAGIESDVWRLEGFIRNAFDDRTIQTAARSADFTKGNFDITDFVVNVTPAAPRQVGVRLSRRF
ncbi:TonB-dependent receptor [Lentisalinibacter orientalis]|uniref:TonB-dependent receptor n=1 Tax=Lentisalinibacter orientalis TaxID=2992241 RepID=UPI00386E891D